jgi:hypothetical protein
VVVDRRSAADIAPEKEQIMRACKVDEATAERAIRGKIPWDAPTFVDQGQVNNCVIWCEIRVRKVIVGDYQRREIIANLCFTDVDGVARIEGEMDRTARSLGVPLPGTSYGPSYPYGPP